jgi:MarR family 2-MHQ and catechol resistance regulon transcriptional repressor
VNPGETRLTKARWDSIDNRVSRVDSGEDRRVRIVALTPRGKDLIVSAFRKHSGQMTRVFSELSPEKLHALEEALKKAGKRAAALMEQS